MVVEMNLADILHAIRPYVLGWVAGMTTIARYTTNAGQSIPDNTTTILDYEDLGYDTHNAVTVGSGWHFTAPAAAYYLVSAALMFVATTTWAETERSELYLCKNGSIHSALDRKDHYASGSNVYMQLGGSDVLYLDLGDTLDIRVNQNSGAALALYNNPVYNYVSIARL